MPPKPVPNTVNVVPSVVDIPVGEGTSSAPNKRKRRDKRERHGDKIRRYFEKHGKIPLTFKKSDGRPIGDYARTFMTELGVVVKKFAPIQVLSWKHVTEEQKIPLFDRLSAIFDIDLGIGPESVREETDTHMGNIIIDTARNRYCDSDTTTIGMAMQLTLYSSLRNASHFVVESLSFSSFSGTRRGSSDSIALAFQDFSGSPVLKRGCQLVFSFSFQK